MLGYKTLTPEWGLAERPSEEAYISLSFSVSLCDFSALLRVQTERPGSYNQPSCSYIFTKSQDAF